MHPDICNNKLNEIGETVLPIKATLRSKDLVDALLLAGVPASVASARISNFQRQGLIQPRGWQGEAVNSAASYSWEDAGACLMLSSALEAGIRDRELLKLVSIACFHWAKAAAPNAWTPIASAVRDTLETGSPWMLRLDIGRDLDSAARVANVSFGRMDDEPTWLDTEACRMPRHAVASSILINTTPLAALSRLIARKRGN